mmetsp:Transcript_29069/g.64483  ORF Transcript_29069/g.64483 Transcript_29069/m.64483 type:complete len:745 (+) Transcript_29069:159-2393(+)
MPLNHLESFTSRSFSNLLDALQIAGPRALRVSPRSGGRRPNKADEPSLDTGDVEVADGADASDGDTNAVAGKIPGKTWLTPSKPTEARLTIVQITDVYTLDNFASLKTMLETIRARQGPNDTVISMLTGDFLSPYLLSSIDRGKGMMNALAATPIDIVIWGNHEADIDHRTVCKHVKGFPGTWINTNMQSHEAMEHQVPYKIIDISSPDGSNVRRVGLVAVLSDDPKLYSHFKPPGAFGGASIEDPWDTLRIYKKILEKDEGCDVVLPLQHLYVPDDRKTCRNFDFPCILSGHDHHRVDQIVEGTRLIKPGMDGIYATVLEMVWDSTDQAGSKPRIRSTFVETSTYPPCPVLKAQTDAAYDVLLPLRNTELVRVPSRFEPLSSVNARGSVTTMGMFLCTLIKDSLNQTLKSEGEEELIDAVILMGGNIRGGEDYMEGSFFSLEMLEAEIKSDEVIGVVEIPGTVLSAGIEVTHAGDPIPGWMQYDEGIREEQKKHGSIRVTAIGGKPIDPKKIYRVATKISDLGNGQSPPFKTYFTAHPELLPSKGSYFNIQTELMGFFARTLFRKLWDFIGKKIQPNMEKVASSPNFLAAAASDEITKSPALLAAAADVTGIPEAVLESAAESTAKETDEILHKVESGLRLDILDTSGDGVVSVQEIHAALRDMLGLSVHDDNQTLAEYVHAHADATGNGVVSNEDFEHFCTVLPGGVGKYYSGSGSKVDENTSDEHRKEESSDEDDDEGLIF